MVMIYDEENMDCPCIIICDEVFHKLFMMLVFILQILTYLVYLISLTYSTISYLITCDIIVGG